MIFVGDIALPFQNSINHFKFPDSLLKENWIGNLEGAIVKDSPGLKEKSIVYNDKEAIQELLNGFSFSGFLLANNHILDAGSLDSTISFLEKSKIPFGGIGKNLRNASSSLVINEKGKEVVILNFGWEVIQCEVTKGNSPGVNPLVKNHVLTVVEDTIRNHPEAFVIPFMHWSYELESEPQPFERELAKNLIDMGVAGVIGAHPHRIGGFELYKGKPIVYSLGNWMFKQNYYFDGKLKFPDFCNRELAFEWDFKSNDFKFHFFDYDREKSTLTYSHTEDRDSETMTSFTPFRDLSDEDYKKWYRKNHYHRKKGLPIYYWEDSEMKVQVKNKINRLRDSLLQLVLRFR